MKNKVIFFAQVVEDPSSYKMIEKQNRTGFPILEVSAKGEVNSAACCLDGHSTKATHGVHVLFLRGILVNRWFRDAYVL
jgi:hypothetical protein